MTIPADPRLAGRISEAAAHGALSHAIILSGQGDLAAAARYTAAAMQCGEANRPCGQCPACSKVLRGIHPDVITVEDPEHKNISIDVLRSVRADAYIIPNEGARKVYIFPDCDKLDPKAQNVLLKVVEEGPPHAAFLFCAENSAQLLQTIRSRSVEWKLAPREGSSTWSEEAQQLCLLISARKRADIAAFCADLENSKVSREELQSILSDARDLLTAALSTSYGAGNGDSLAARLAREMDRRRIAAAIEVLQRFIRECGYNIGVGHLTGALAVALEQ
ncbi:MAG: DNA polymerase III subunit delta' [Oscillospiraceae bacterium]|nr:DNA polymerase III subunit delta' [Oscillospiraceae bacterium]